MTDIFKRKNKLLIFIDVLNKISTIIITYYDISYRINKTTR